MLPTLKRSLEGFQLRDHPLLGRKGHLSEMMSEQRDEEN
jgi:hypothetical protein